MKENKIKKSEIKLKENQLTYLDYLYSYGTTIFLVITLILCARFYYYAEYIYEAPNAFVNVDDQTRIVEEKPTTEDQEPIEDLKQDIVDIIYDFFDVNYVNIERKPVEMKTFFDEDVFNNVIVPYYDSSNDARAIRKQKSIMYAARVEPLQLIESKINGAQMKEYYFKTKARVLRKDKNKTVPQMKIIEITVLRVPLRFSDTGWLISSVFIADEK